MTATGAGLGLHYEHIESTKVCYVASVDEFLRDNPTAIVLDWQITPYGVEIEYLESQSEQSQTEPKAPAKQYDYVVSTTPPGRSKMYMAKQGRAVFSLAGAMRFGPDEAEEKAIWATIRSRTGLRWQVEKVRRR